MLVGVDPDTKRIAFAAIEHGRVLRVGTLDRADSRGRILPGYDAALTAFMRRAQETGAVVYVEDIYLAGRNAGSVAGFKSLAQVQGEILRVARQHSVPVVLVAASTWHSSMLGFTKGRESLKAAAQTKARELTGRDDLSEHEADAVCIALYGSKLEAAKRQALMEGAA